MEITLSIAFFIIALLFGSFTNVLIYRVPRSESISDPGSHCPSCKNPIKPWENIPILSYLFLKGKCSNCSCKIPISYPLIELLFALIAANFIYRLIYLQEVQLMNILQLFFIFIFLSIAIALAVIDKKHQELPHQLTYSGILIALVYVLIHPKLDLSNAIVAVGAMFFIFDCFTHFANKIYFQKDALAITPATLTYRLEILSQNISWVYTFYLLLTMFLLYSANFMALKLLFLVLGILYIINDIFVDYFYLKPSQREFEGSREFKTAMGGGDAAMAALIASIFASVHTSLKLVWAAFFVALFIVLTGKLAKLFNGKKFTLKGEKTPFGVALTIVLIAGMILESVVNSNFAMA